ARLCRYTIQPSSNPTGPEPMNFQIEQPYNPLDKLRLAESVVRALLERDARPLPPSPFQGAGIYAIYYLGLFEAYRPNSYQNRDGRLGLPIYVGKAIPAGGRQGGFGLAPNPTTALFTRLSQHASSVNDAYNLDLADFACRYLVVDDI